MRWPWLYFCYRFDASVVNALTLSIPHVSCHSVFVHDFKVYNDSIFANDLWFSHDIAFLTIPCVGFDSIFFLSIPYMSWHSVFNDDFKFYSESVFADDLWISRDIAFLTIPCVGHDSIFAIDLMRRSWIHGRYGFHTSAGTQYSLTVSRSIVTMFSVMIYRSAVT
jgi:hypothetical protein